MTGCQRAGYAVTFEGFFAFFEECYMLVLKVNVNVGISDFKLIRILARAGAGIYRFPGYIPVGTDVLQKLRGFALGINYPDAVASAHFKGSACKGVELQLPAGYIVILLEFIHKVGNCLRVRFSCKILIHHGCQLLRRYPVGIIAKLVCYLLIQILPAEFLVFNKVGIICLDLRRRHIGFLVVHETGLSHFDCVDKILKEGIGVSLRSVHFRNDREGRILQIHIGVGGFRRSIPVEEIGFLNIPHEICAAASYLHRHISAERNVEIVINCSGNKVILFEGFQVAVNIVGASEIRKILKGFVQTSYNLKVHSVTVSGQLIRGLTVGQTRAVDSVNNGPLSKNIPLVII